MTVCKALLCGYLTAEVGHGRGGAVALEAQLDVALEVVLASHTSGAATHAEGRDGVGHHHLHLAERAERRHNRLAHVSENQASRGCAQRRGEARNRRRRLAAVRGPRRRGEGVRRRVVGVHFVEHAGNGDEILSVVQCRLHIGEQGGHLYIPDLEINSGGDSR